jgi:hypothetical protein
VARPDAHLAELKQQLAAVARVGVDAQLLELQRPLEPGARLLPRERRRGAVGGAPRVPERGLRAEGVARLVEVVRELREMRLGVGGVQGLECLAGAPVGIAAPAAKPEGVAKS